MAEIDEGQMVTTPQEADWEVVSLTASVYAASPGGRMPEVNHDEKNEMVDKDNLETSSPLFISGHFAFPPRQQENAPSEPEKTEIFENLVGKDDGYVSVNYLSGCFESNSKEEENWDLKKLTEMSFTENTTLNLTGIEKSIYDSPTLHALPIDDELSVVDEFIDSSNLPLGSNTPNLPLEEDNHEGPGYAVWLKKQVVCLYAHTKETNTLWSVFAVAAVIGMVIIGHKWQQEKGQVLRHEWKSRTHDEVRMVAGPIARFSYAIIDGNQHDILVNGSIFGEL